MADGKDRVRVELTFHKDLPTQPVFKKMAESRRQPAPSDGEWPRQPTATRRSQPTRSKPTAQPTVRREAPEKETSPPALQIMEITPDTITVSRPPQAAQLTPSPSIKKPATPTPSPKVPRAKRPRTKSPKYTIKQPTQYFHTKIEDEYPLQEKYDLQDVHAPLQGHHQSYKAARGRRRTQHRSTSILRLLEREQTLATDQPASSTMTRGTPTSRCWWERPAWDRLTRHTGMTSWKRHVRIP